MSEKKELNLEELENVTGGRDTHVYLPEGTFGDVIDKYDAANHIGVEVYVVTKAFRFDYCWGILEDSREIDNQWGGTVRTHTVNVTGRAKYASKFSGETKFSGDDYDLFYKIK